MKLLEHICNSGISARVFEYLRDEREIISSEVPELREYVSHLVRRLERTADNPHDSRSIRMLAPEWNRDYGHILHETREQVPRIELPNGITRCYQSEYYSFPWIVVQHSHPSKLRGFSRIPVYEDFQWMFKRLLRLEYQKTMGRSTNTKAVGFQIVESSSHWAPLLAESRSSWLPYWSILFNFTGRDLDDDFCPHCQSREKYFRSTRLGICVWGDCTEIVGIGYLVGQLLDENSDPIPYY